MENKTVLVIGSGSCEDAICWKLSQSDQIGKLFALPGSFHIGTRSKVQLISHIPVHDHPSIVQFSKEQAVDLVVVGSTDALADGIVDSLIAANIKCFGPTLEATLIETDKSWAKEFVTSAGILPEYRPSFQITQITTNTSDGIHQECAANDDIQLYGVPTKKLPNEEVSVLAFYDGHTMKLMLPVQTCAPLNDGLGNLKMNALCPSPSTTPEHLASVRTEIVDKALTEFKKRGINYCGVFSINLIVTATGPRILKFGCRFGCPETEVLFPLLKTDLYEIIDSCCSGQLTNIEIEWKEMIRAAGTVMVSEDPTAIGRKIIGLPTASGEEIVFHNGTTVIDDEYVTNGWHVLTHVSVTGNAQDIVALGANKIKFVGRQFYLNFILNGQLVSELYTYMVEVHEPNMVSINKLQYPLSADEKLNYKDPVLVQSAVRVSDKLSMAMDCGAYETIGQDLVAQAVNQLICTGAQPFAFLASINYGGLCIPIIQELIQGMAKACQIAQITPLKRNLEQKRSWFSLDLYDLFGHSVGCVEYGNELPRFDLINEGDSIIGLRASGLHCSGIDIVRAIMKELNIDYFAKAPFSVDNKTYAEEFMVPSSIYVKRLLPFITSGVIKSASYITHSGLLGAIANVIPPQFGAEIETHSWTIPPVFGWIQSKSSQLTSETLTNHFNLGIGLVAVVPTGSAEWKSIEGAIEIGKVVSTQTSPGVDFIGLEQNMRQISLAFVAVEAQDLKMNIKSESDRKGIERHKFLRLKDNCELIENELKLVFSIEAIEEERLCIGETINKFDTFGVDLVGRSTSNLLSHGAKPLSFHSHYTCYDADNDLIGTVMKGFAEGCSLADFAMFTSDGIEVLKMFKKDEFSLVGVAIGIYLHEFDNRHDIGFGDYVIAIPSNGMTIDGVELLLKSMKKLNAKMEDDAPFSGNRISFGEELLAPNNIDVAPIVALIKEGKIKKIIVSANSFIECLSLPFYLTMYIDADKMCMSPFLKWIATGGLATDEELAKLYNCCTAFFLIVDKKHGPEIQSRLTTMNAKIVGVLEQSGKSIIIDGEKWARNLRGEQPMEEDDQRETTNELLTPIMKLKYGHFEEIFDWLSLWDLIAVAETCKRLQHLAGCYFQQNYRLHCAEWVYGGILSRYDLNMNIFSKFVQRLAIYRNWTINHYRDARDFISVKDIGIYRVEIHEDTPFKDLLGRLEIVQLNHCAFSVEFHQNFLRYCANVKHLRINKCEHGNLIGTDNSWLLRDYPTLERMEIIPHDDSAVIPGLVHFLDRHTRIKHFATNVPFILLNRNLLICSAIRLDVLSVMWRAEETPSSFIVALNELYERGIFKHLHLVGSYVPFDQDIANVVASFLGLKKLVINYYDAQPVATLPCITSLKELVIGDGFEVVDMETTARNLANLESVEFHNVNQQSLLAFIRNSPKLCSITLQYLDDTEADFYNIIQLFELNEEREKLSMTKRVRKIDIFVPEDIYLTTKWAHKEIHLSKIELKRKDSCVFQHDSFSV